MGTQATRTHISRYEQWCNDPNIHEDDRAELAAIAGDEEEILKRFYSDINFGTGGMRTTEGLGSALWNTYTIGRVMQGIANKILEIANKSAAPPRIVIGFDTRMTSAPYARSAAAVMVANGIHTSLFSQPRPTAMISFAVRHFKATMGIVVTASHNPMQYNGFKVYGADGAQLLPEPSAEIIEAISDVRSYSEVKRYDGDVVVHPLVHTIDEQFDHVYLFYVLTSRLQSEENPSDMTIAYTSLHGTGAPIMFDMFRMAKYNNVVYDAEQCTPSGAFPTIAHPNPEDPAVMQRVIDVARQHRAKVALATDPDCDRLAVSVLDAHTGEYVMLTGNQIGALLCDYVCSNRKEVFGAPHTDRDAIDYFIVKTIVTSDLGAAIARSYGVHVEETLTGFKYIAEKMNMHDGLSLHGQRERRFLLGYEESHGYLLGNYARDKDAVIAAVVLCDALKAGGDNRSALQQLEALYERHGYYEDRTVSISLRDMSEFPKIQRAMDRLRAQPMESIGGLAVTRVLDYEQDGHGLPKENVLKFLCADRSWVCVRPSGTEPKMKVYFSAIGTTRQEAQQKFAAMHEEVQAIVQQFFG
ncbi:MAG: phospho-sugar mutase [Paenibacillaceae bacterium]|nr:phospho-sugar mutase [Paenibacillaceae bacterium]